MAWSGRAGSRCTYTDDRTESDGETQEWECSHGVIDGRASYTLAASAALIAAYAGLYVAIAPDLFGSVGQYAQLSLGSFIAFFLGGFFVALYVFALTRSASR
ncbi:hypothetical protein [Haloarcula sp. Atlit-7R]|uniref:hypothetical protein n=1 Tax=Haloarcula sp. Atlit-7R TaxID=2282125 RepID=UPI001F2D1E25|nr:hypothetical protein [Haloarcula sp. Atlit-7R]